MRELEVWEKMGVLGQHERWVDYHTRLTKSTATIVGAKLKEVVVMNALTINLHLLLISFYQPTPKRNKIIIITVITTPTFLNPFKDLYHSNIFIS